MTTVMVRLEPGRYFWSVVWPLRSIPLAFAAVLGIAGCAQQQAFRPTEHVTARSLSGVPAADYELTARTGDDLGEIKVWSGGADTAGGADATELHLGFEIENEGKVPMILDAKGIYLDSLTVLEETVRNVRATRAEGSTSVEPGGVGQLHVTFVLQRVDPGDIEGFQVRWTVSSGDFRRSERTPFAPVRRVYPHYPYYYGPYPYYYPYYYGPFYPHHHHLHHHRPTH